MDNLDIGEARVNRSKEKVSIYVTQGRVTKGNIVWKCKIYKEDVAELYRMGQVIEEPSTGFHFSQGILTEVEDLPPLPQLDDYLIRVMVGLPRRKEGSGRQVTFVGHLQDKIAIVEAFYWQDGSGLFQTETSYLRILQNIGDSLENKNAQKWQDQTRWRLATLIVWHGVW